MDEEETAASASNDPQDGSGTVCDYCGTAIDTSDWYLVTHDRDADGSVQLHNFCCEDCQDAWLDEPSD